MSEILNRFSFDTGKLTLQVLVCALVIWGAVVWCAISSILVQPFSRPQRIFWIAMVVAVPLIGLLAYLPFSFRREDLPPIFASRPKDRPRKPVPSTRSQPRESDA